MTPVRLFVLALPLLAQQQEQRIPAPTIEEYDPKPMLVVPKTEAPRAKYPFIDIHTHHRDATPAALDKLIRDMDQLNMRIMVNSPVSGSFGPRTKALIDGMRAHPQRARFATMTNLNYALIDQPDKLAAQLEEDIKNGAIGVKVWKNLGMREKDGKGERIAVDDARLKPAWDVCAKYKIPVMIHTADP